MTKSIEARLAALADKAHELRARIRTLGESLSPEVVVDQAEELETLCGRVVAEARALSSEPTIECKACAARAKRGLEGRCPACATGIIRSAMAAERAERAGLKAAAERTTAEVFGVKVPPSWPPPHNGPEFADDEIAEKIAAWLARQAGNTWAEMFARAIRRGDYK